MPWKRPTRLDLTVRRRRPGTRGEGRADPGANDFLREKTAGIPDEAADEHRRSRDADHEAVFAIAMPLLARSSVGSPADETHSFVDALQLEGMRPIPSPTMTAPVIAAEAPRPATTSGNTGLPVPMTGSNVSEELL